MKDLFKTNGFRTDYKKRPNDEYKALCEKLDDETKRRFARQRTWVMTGVIALVFLLIILLAVTGLGTGKEGSDGVIPGFRILEGVSETPEGSVPEGLAADQERN